jgi:D-alanine-D-alanine ligase
LKDAVKVVILSGAISEERDVSLRSGRRAHRILAQHFPTCLIELESNSLPKDLDPRRALIFPLIHGNFGEDGHLQRLLEVDGFIYVGSGIPSMELTINKTLTKNCVAEGGVPVLPQIAFSARKPMEFSFGDLCQRIGARELFLKPNDKGSSLQCYPCRNATQLAEALENVRDGEWVIEALCRGRDLTVGVLHGRALAAVEIRHGDGFFDYDAKYTAGRAEHIVPATIGEDLAFRMRFLAERSFALCHCRDWARVDFILREDGEPFFLELNSIPGFTDTSLFPDSATGCGISPEDCLCALVRGAMERHRQRFL